MKKFISKRLIWGLTCLLILLYSSQVHAFPLPTSDFTRIKNSAEQAVRIAKMIDEEVKSTREMVRHSQNMGYAIGADIFKDIKDGKYDRFGKQEDQQKDLDEASQNTQEVAEKEEKDRAENQEVAKEDMEKKQEQEEKAEGEAEETKKENKKIKMDNVEKEVSDFFRKWRKIRTGNIYWENKNSWLKKPETNTEQSGDGNTNTDQNGQTEGENADKKTEEPAKEEAETPKAS